MKFRRVVRARRSQSGRGGIERIKSWTPTGFYMKLLRKILNNYMILSLFFFIADCTTERQRCMDQIVSSDLQGACEPFLMALAYQAKQPIESAQANAFGDTLLIQCAQLTLREDRCEKKSNIKPIFAAED